MITETTFLDITFLNGFQLDSAIRVGDEFIVLAKNDRPWDAKNPISYATAYWDGKGREWRGGRYFMGRDAYNNALTNLITRAVRRNTDLYVAFVKNTEDGE